ncbi:MAG: peptidylprolyl isomerase [Chloroflexi bacterium]|nr:peptidylprolyl isomerase [Chloroflexota bacterium]
MAQIQNDHPGQIRLIFRHFPLTSIHDKALISTQAVEAAGLQGKFWEMHDVLFSLQAEWFELTVEQFQDWAVDHAGKMGLDKGKFKTDMLSAEIAVKAQKAWDDGVEVGMPGTPFLLVNGLIWPQDLPMSYGNLSAVINLELLEERQFSECPPVTIDPSRQYVATLHLEAGDVVVELFPDVAPFAVNNFVFLARNGWYDNITFHRVLEGFMAQTGDPSGTGYGTPGYAFQVEISPNLKFDKPGLLAMANAGPDSNGSQFFITYAAADHLNGGYTIFGQVLSGMEVLDRLRVRDPEQGFDQPAGDRLLSVEIEEK